MLTFYRRLFQRSETAVRMRSVPLILLSACLGVTTRQPVITGPPADLVVHNGGGLHDGRRKPAAEAFAVRAGEFVAVGASTDMLAVAGTVNAPCSTPRGWLVPGLQDAHGHVLGLRRAPPGAGSARDSELRSHR